MKYRFLIVAGLHKEEVIVNSFQELVDWLERLTVRFGVVDLVYNLGRV